ncbi:MAG TPA: hypothetical protein VFT22_30165 [Kofleriaceae bacterium]|nr:hypothetical protein [Kofleriaceae bacterium]
MARAPAPVGGVGEAGAGGGRDFYFPPRSITALPDGSGAYYAGVLLDGNDLGVERYAVNQPIIAVSPDGR